MHDSKKRRMKYSFFQTSLVFCESIKVKIPYVEILGRPLMCSVSRHVLLHSGTYFCAKKGRGN